jgi:DnaJ homolog subfamily A member 2
MFFHQFGGMGGGAPRGAPVSENTALYAALEIEKGATESEVRKAYRHLAMKHHPDKGGDPEKFKEISKAYETLSDPVARKKYDSGGGEDNVGIPHAGDIFSTMFGNNHRRRTDDVVRELRVTLEEVYAGCTKKLIILRKVVNRQDGAIKVCDLCGGNGVRVEVMRIGVMLQQIQSQCGGCGGLGKTCGYLEERSEVDVYVPRGVPDGHRILCRGLTDEVIDSDPGDVVFVVRQIPHESFIRRNSDLYVPKNISLIEALGGFEIEVSHLDGRCLVVKSPPDEVVRMSEKVDPSIPLVAWETMEDHDCASNTVAEAATDDVEVLRRACEKELNERGVQSEAFVVEGKKAYFKQGTAKEAREAKMAAPGKTLHVRASRPPCMMYAVEGEGMPLLSNPSLKGNLFLELTLVLPVSLQGDALEKLREILPPPLNGRSSEDPDECDAILMDSVNSYETYAHLQRSDDDPPLHRSGVQAGVQAGECRQQ